MDFDLTDEQRAVRNTFARFSDTQIAPRAARWFLVPLIFGSLLLFAVVSFCGPNRVLADPPDLSFMSDPRLQAARVRMNDGFPDAEQMYQTIINANPRAQVAGAAKLAIAYKRSAEHNFSEALRLSQEVASDFKDMPVGILAAVSTINLQYGNTPAWMDQFNTLLTHIGGIPIQTAIHSVESPEGSPAFPFRPVTFLQHDVQQALLQEFYGQVAATLDSMAMSGTVDSITYDPGKAHDVIDLYHFMRERFANGDQAENARGINTIFTILRVLRPSLRNQTSSLDDTVPPRIQPIAPHDGLTTFDTQPKIEVSLSDGSIVESQIDISAIRFTLDGQDIKSRVLFRSNLDLSGNSDVIFERLALTYVPTIPLASGVHTVFIYVSDLAGNAAQLQWSFTVW